MVLQTEQTIFKLKEEIFEFFSNAENLEFHTPSFLKFIILTKFLIEMREVIEIAYRLKLYWVPLKWESLITSWQPYESFIDEQVKNLYTKWVHTHIFESVESVCLIKDLVNYKVFGDSLTSNVFVSKNLRKLFEYRTQRLMEYFNEPCNDNPATKQLVQITRI